MDVCGYCKRKADLKCEDLCAKCSDDLDNEVWQFVKDSDEL
jgi:hypothetical protein